MIWHCEIDPNNWKVAVGDCDCQRWTVKEGIEKADVKKWAAKAASLCPRPTSFASCVVETATHTLAYTATQDVAVPLRINKSGQALLLN